MIPRGSWVQIHKIILNPSERVASLPEATRQVPLELWVKGFLSIDANLGDLVVITTITGRVESGTLLALNPSYRHDFGQFVPELLEIGRIVREQIARDSHE
jgi:hypothetical protein